MSMGELIKPLINSCLEFSFHADLCLSILQKAGSKEVGIQGWGPRPLLSAQHRL